MRLLKQVEIQPGCVRTDGTKVESLCGLSLSEIYRKVCNGYPKFFKMNGLCKTGFVAAEILLEGLTPEQKAEGSVILFGRAGSLATDRNYENTIRDPENYYPSPALFVYTLANIVTGEIAIRHKMQGESSMYVLPEYDNEAETRTVQAAFDESDTPLIVSGWVDYENDDNYQAILNLYIKD